MAVIPHPNRRATSGRATLLSKSLIISSFSSKLSRLRDPLSWVFFFLRASGCRNPCPSLRLAELEGLRLLIHVWQMRWVGVSLPSYTSPHKPWRRPPHPPRHSCPHSCPLGAINSSFGSWHRSPAAHGMMSGGDGWRQLVYHRLWAACWGSASAA